MTLRYKKLAGIGLALAAVATLGGCYDDGYGYGGVSVGYGGGGYNGYDDYAYGYPGYYGWYDGFYYPGSGYWIYDRGGNRHRWNDQQRRHWEGRREAWRNRGGQERAGRDDRWRGRPRDSVADTRGFGTRVDRNDGGVRGWRGRGGERSWGDRGNAVRSAPAPRHDGGRGFRGRARDRD